MRSLVLLSLLMGRSTALAKLDYSVSPIKLIPRKFETPSEEVSYKKKFHGGMKKIVTPKVKVKSTGEKELTPYYQQVISEITSQKSKILKKLAAKNLKAGKVFVKIQVQRNGGYDVLYLGGDSRKLDSITGDIFSSIKSFPSFPNYISQEELQLSFDLVFK